MSLKPNMQLEESSHHLPFKCKTISKADQQVLSDINFLEYPFDKITFCNIGNPQ